MSQTGFHSTNGWQVNCDLVSSGLLKLSLISILERHLLCAATARKCLSMMTTSASLRSGLSEALEVHIPLSCTTFRWRLKQYLLTRQKGHQPCLQGLCIESATGIHLGAQTQTSAGLLCVKRISYWGTHPSHANASCTQTFSEPHTMQVLNHPQSKYSELGCFTHTSPGWPWTAEEKAHLATLVSLSISFWKKEKIAHFKLGSEELKQQGISHALWLN